MRGLKVHIKIDLKIYLKFRQKNNFFPPFKIERFFNFILPCKNEKSIWIHCRIPASIRMDNLIQIRPAVASPANIFARRPPNRPKFQK